MVVAKEIRRRRRPFSTGINLSSWEFASVIRTEGRKLKTYTRQELLDVIKNLPEGYRMVFNLYAVEGYKHKEIAELLEIDINTSKSQYSRARSLIRKKLFALKKERTKAK